MHLRFIFSIGSTEKLDEKVFWFLFFSGTARALGSRSRLRVGGGIGIANFSLEKGHRHWCQDDEDKCEKGEYRRDAFANAYRHIYLLLLLPGTLTARCVALTAYASTHIRIGHDVLHAVVIHDAEVALSEGFGYGLRYFRLLEYYLGAVLLYLGDFFLFQGLCGGPTLFGDGLEPALVRFRLIGLEFCPHVLTHIHVRDVDRENLEGRSRVEALLQHR